MVVKSKLTMKILLSVLLILFVGCTRHFSNEPETLPANATNIINKGNGWSTFELEGKKFLYHNAIMGYKGFECITQIK